MALSHLIRSLAYIDGQWVAEPSGKSFEVSNPLDGEVIATVPDMDADMALHAVDAAANALPAWRARTAESRADILWRWHELLLEHKDDLARLMTLEQGKPLQESKGEIAYGAGFLRWFAEEARRVYGDIIPTHMTDKRLLVLKQPIGVVAAITPWNFPNAMIARKVAPALAAGCTVVIKPAEATPLSALALAYLGEQAGLPSGVLNVVTTTDAAATGEAWCTSSKVRKLSFTGSTDVGKILLRQCADTVKKVSLELGGNAPLVVFEDADLEAAVAGAIAGKYRNAGQTCVCINRLIVHHSVADAFTEKLVTATRQLSVGNGLDEGVDIGPLIDESALKFVEEVIADAKKKGATIATGGKRVLEGQGYAPTVLKGATPAMRVFNEEIFGPVAPIYTFESEKEAIALANDTQYGLAGYFYSRDVGRIWRVAEALEYGMLGINTGLLSTPVAPFGGIKESGIGREGSKYGIEEYLETKYLCLGL